MAHAFFSPSGSTRWLNCPGSLTLSAYAPKGDGDNKYSVEGTAAHALIEHCIKNEIDPFQLLDLDTFEHIEGYPMEKLKEFGILDEIWAKREQTIQDISHFVNYAFSLMDEGYEIHSELRLKVDGYQDRCWGTGDLVAWKQETRHLVIADYKNGVGYVAALAGQLILYGVGAIDTLKVDPAKITTTVVQPNAVGEPVRSHEWTADQLGLASQKYRTTMDAYLKDPVQRTKAGPHCKYCRAKLICQTFQASADNISLNTYGDDAIKQGLARIPAIKLWIKDIEARAYKRLMEGGKPAAVGAMLNMSSPHRRLRDAVPDDDGNLTTLVDAVKKEFGSIAFSKPEIKTPAQLDKLPGGKAFTEKWAYKPKGALTLAGLDSKKPHVMPQSAKDRLEAIAGVKTS